MKKERVIGIVFATVNAVLLVVCVILYLGMDRTEPRFEFQAVNMVYREGMDIHELVNGISAYDEEDGDLTDSIVVEKLIENRAGSSVIVFYAVSDKAGNVAKCSREFAAVFLEETQKGDVGERMSGSEGIMQEGLLVQAGFWNDLKGSPEEGKQEESSDGDEFGSEEDNKGDEGVAGEEEEDSDSVKETQQSAGNGEEGPEGENRGEPEQETGEVREWENRDAGGEDDEDTGSAPPVLSLQVSEVKTQVGVAPAWVQVIGTLTDDKDSYETLFHNLEVSKYNINEAGTYQVTVSTKDSDGNRSREAPLTIIVK